MRLRQRPNVAPKRQRDSRQLSSSSRSGFDSGLKYKAHFSGSEHGSKSIRRRRASAEYTRCISGYGLCVDTQARGLERPIDPDERILGVTAWRESLGSHPTAGLRRLGGRSPRPYSSQAVAARTKVGAGNDCEAGGFRKSSKGDGGRTRASLADVCGNRIHNAVHLRNGIVGKSHLIKELRIRRCFHHPLHSRATPGKRRP
jgi:hypothetical protein